MNVASIKELLSAMIAKINGKNEGVDWNENDETSPAFVKNRPFYEESLVSVPHPNMSGVAWYKVSSSVPSGDHSAGAAITLLANGKKYSSVIYMSTDDFYFDGDGVCIITLKDNVVIEILGGCTFPGKGTYFCCSDMITITGVALGKDADPEITWDGSTGEVKSLMRSLFQLCPAWL